MEYRKIPGGLLILCICLMAMAAPMYAYIDPNASGLISQIVTPLLVVAAAAITFLRRRLGLVFSALAARIRRSADASGD
jgi:Na+/H+ antiporter NhaB